MHAYLQEWPFKLYLEIATKPEHCDVTHGVATNKCNVNLRHFSVVTRIFVVKNIRMNILSCSDIFANIWTMWGIWRQTMRTQIRLFREQSDLDQHCFLIRLL